MENRRRHERCNECLEIKVTWPGHGTLIGNTMDFSAGGTFIKLAFSPEPPVDTLMLLQLNSLVMGKEAPILKARLVRTTPAGMAFEFILDE